MLLYSPHNGFLGLTFFDDFFVCNSTSDNTFPIFTSYYYTLKDNSLEKLHLVSISIRACCIFFWFYNKDLQTFFSFFFCAIFRIWNQNFLSGGLIFDDFWTRCLPNVFRPPSALLFMPEKEFFFINWY